MIPYKITAEVISKACSYVPIETKWEFAMHVAENCFTTLRISSDAPNGKSKPMPSMYKVNTALKSRYLMGAFMKLYIQEDFTPVEGDAWLMAQDDYNNYKSGHIFNEMNRFKSNNDIRDKVFDILTDYKELVTMVETEIEGSLKAMNDPVARFSMMFTELMTPDELGQMIDDINEQKDELEKYIAEQRKAAEIEKTESEEQAPKE